LTESASGFSVNLTYSSHANLHVDCACAFRQYDVDTEQRRRNGPLREPEKDQVMRGVLYASLAVAIGLAIPTALVIWTLYLQWNGVN